MVNTVDGVGDIVSAFCYGTASLFAADTSYTGLSGVNVIGTGTGATWDIDVVPGEQTIFDGGSIQFTDPADIDTNTNAYDRYLLFPRKNILTPLPTYEGQPVGWTNNALTVLPWVNDLGQVVGWISTNT